MKTINHKMNKDVKNSIKDNINDYTYRTSSINSMWIAVRHLITESISFSIEDQLRKDLK